MLSSISSYSTQPSNATASKPEIATTEKAFAAVGEENDVAEDSAMPVISALSIQLAASAARAEQRDSSLSRKQLAATAASIQDQLWGETYYKHKAQYDSEIPNTSNPALLARAKQATAFVNDAANGKHSVKNPFAGLSRAQLANIAYDESGTFTVNERQAALHENDEQEERWRVWVCAAAIDEYNRTGKMTHFFSAVLAHYQGLPAIEQAEYPANYASDLQSKIDLDFDYKGNMQDSTKPGITASPTSLIEMVFEEA